MDLGKFSSPISQSQAYQTFRSSVPLKKLAVDAEDPDKVWKIYDCGSKEVTCPLFCLPPVSGTADCFFAQCLNLSSKGYRVIAAESPPYWTTDEWCRGFKNLLTHLDIEKVHIFGAALGGFLAQKFAEYTQSCPRVASLILCNTFTDTSVFKYSDQAPVFWMMPGPMLRSLVSGGLDTTSNDAPIINATHFMEERLETLDQSVLASRLNVNCAPNYVQPHMVNDLPVTIINVWDESALSQEVKDDIYKCYPQAKKAHLKTGGNFPFLSRSEEVNLHILIHMRNFDNAVA